MNTTQHARRTTWTIRENNDMQAGWKLEHEAGEDTVALVQVAPEESFLEELSPEIVHNEMDVPISLLLELHEAFSGTVLHSYTDEWVETEMLVDISDGLYLHTSSGEQCVSLEGPSIEDALVFNDPWVLDEFMPYLEEAYTTLCK